MSFKGHIYIYGAVFSSYILPKIGGVGYNTGPTFTVSMQCPLGGLTSFFEDKCGFPTLFVSRISNSLPRVSDGC